jgi:hypothetical protein
MRKFGGILCLVAGLCLIAWLAWGYFFLALLTSRILEGVSIQLLFEGFLRCLLSVPGIAGMLLAATGVALLKHRA